MSVKKHKWAKSRSVSIFLASVVTSFVIFLCLPIISGFGYVFAAGESYTANAAADGAITIAGSGGIFDLKDGIYTDVNVYSPDFTRQADGTYKSIKTYTYGVGINSVTITNALTLTIADADTVNVAGTCTAASCPGNPSSSASLNANGLTAAQITQGTSTPPENPEGEEPGTEEVNCYDIGGIFSWIICTVGEYGSKVIGVIDQGLYGLLSIDMNDWESSGAKSAWASMRTIASTLIVLVTLVGVASQIFGFDFISAYTIRKILPKLFIAVIAIQLSWFLGSMAVNITNTIGYSVQALILGPFVEVANANNGSAPDLAPGQWITFADTFAIYAAKANHPDVAAAGVTGVMTLAVIFGGASAVGAGGAALALLFGSALITAAMALIVAFITIIIRYVLLLGLVIVMPLAIVAWILPNTKKWFDRWWAMFFTLLAMFPIIIAFLGFGKAAAIIVALGA